MDTKEYKILHLEDVPTDAELVERALHQGELTVVVTRASGKEDFLQALDTLVPDLILSDYKLPAFDGLSALAMAQEKRPDIPFIFVTGAMGEELAVETLKRGAVDYVLKDKLQQLVPAVERAFRNVASTQKAKEITRAKTEFATLASHQLRTPLGIAKWYLEVLQKDDYLQKAPPQTKEYIANVYKGIERVLHVVRDLLSVSQIDQGRVPDTPTLVSMADLLTPIIQELQIIAQQKKISLTLDILNANVPALAIDTRRFYEVMEDIITNALEYTKASGTVKVSLATKDNTVEIQIQDTGAGISAEDQPKIFTKFFRSVEAVASNPEGSGLGLYIAKSYVEGWGGTITVASALGKGSTFTISLPVLTKDNLKGGEEV